MKTNEVLEAAAGAGRADAAIAEKIAWLETCGTALDAHGSTVLDEVFATVMLTHYSRVARRIQSWRVPECDAEDLLQEVFITLNNRVRSQGAKDGFRRLLAKITWGKLKNHLRDAAQAPETTPIPSSGSALPESAVDVDRALDLRELRRRFFPELSDDHQAVAEKAILGDLSDEETAAALGLPLGTVKSRLRAAKKVLRALGGTWMPESQQEAA